jgi:hypothetical protein
MPIRGTPTVVAAILIISNINNEYFNVFDGCH